MPLLIVKSLNHIRQDVNLTRVAEAIDDLLRGHSNTSAQLANDPNGSDVVPSPISQLQVQHLGTGQIDVAIIDNNPRLVRAVHYHLEYDTDPNFTNPRGRDLGPWRTAEFLLPNGTWHFRAYPQYPAGGSPALPVRAPGPIVVSGSASLSLFPAQGSGTGTPKTGGGHGAGRTITR
jgi:hypothetical protein